MSYRYQSGSCGVGFVCNINGLKSHEIVRKGIEAVKNLTHRGAVGADGKTGDGAGILVQVPARFFLDEIKRCGTEISHIDDLAVGVFFLYGHLEEHIEGVVGKFGFKVICWRDVPVNDDALGSSALSTKPRIRQLFIDTRGFDQIAREQRLYLARRMIEKTYGREVYIPSMSSNTVVYKGLLAAPQLDRFYPDLNEESFESSFCIFHQRFSTNTFPDWVLAQPMRTLAHNGEINTVQGNRNWMSSLEREIGHESFGEYGDLIGPLISLEESDSASLDRIIELFILTGHSAEYAANVCVPPAWESLPLEPGEQAFFEYHAFLMKPWDGPAALVLADGSMVCAHLDRNGLRPLRYTITGDGLMVLGSETGMIDLTGKSIREKGRLGPGDTLSVDLALGRVRYPREIIKELSTLKPYRKWIDKNLFRLKRENLGPPTPDPDIVRKQAAFGYTSEEVRTSLKEMAEKGKEMTFSMGDDTPIPPLCEKPQLLYRYFKQRFSQVTNPPIDPIRERMVMSLKMALGQKKNFLLETPEHARRLLIESPVLSEDQVPGIEKQDSLKVERLSITYSREGAENVSGEIEGGGLTCCVPGRESLLLFAVRRLQRSVIGAVRNGAEILILSDREIAKERVAIPALLAVAAAFRALKREGLANRASIIIETGEARDIHHFACLIGYGASAVHPWLLFGTLTDMCEDGTLHISHEDAASNFRTAVDDGLLKVMARMGISTLNSYHGAQLFDSVCLNRDFVNEFFMDTPVTVESDGLPEVEESLLKRHSAGFDQEAPALDPGGDLRHGKGGEWHHWSIPSVIALNRFVKSADPGLYRDFSRSAEERPVFIRHLLGWRKGVPVAIDEVEPDELILKRFFSGAMSVGALSPEAHETIAEACNTLCIRSNCGEGGEDPARYWTIKNSAIKQIASGRFGVTPTYLASASELEIKMAQGAKPGEGGHLPASKVTEYIGRLRHCRPEILLISPPPHHDIYSIEDLAQLINDLKEANPKAKVCVKLVAETGVGAVAAGVAKAYADIVQICGCEGGTGASPVSSIKNAGNYWEAGLAETQKVLIENGLRERIKVRVDGGLRTGRDIIIAALLGAEEFGFGTAAMIAAGCVMVRHCHLNTCPTGIATQDERLRGKFRGRVEGVTAYFSALAREVREILAEMGFLNLDDIIGRTDLLTSLPNADFPASGRIRLEKFMNGYSEGRPRICSIGKNDNPAPSMNNRLLDDLLPQIERAEPVTREYRIRNVDRSVPAKLSYHISLRYRDKGLPENTINLIFRGAAGQSFGAFNHKGVSLTLIGEANDYAGKGMFGGRIVIKEPDSAAPDGNVIAGNTVLYGATGGEFFCAGPAGERFAVRNSGATAVVEGAGHHLCEYMTRGTVVVLGEVGFNVGAGMTGGVIYVFDKNDTLGPRLNTTYVAWYILTGEDERLALRSLIENHYRFTESPRAREMLRDFGRTAAKFKKIVPIQA